MITASTTSASRAGSAITSSVVTHLRAYDHDLVFPAAYLALAVTSLVLSLASP